MFADSTTEQNFITNLRSHISETKKGCMDKYLHIYTYLHSIEVSEK